MLRFFYCLGIKESRKTHPQEGDDFRRLSLEELCKTLGRGMNKSDRSKIWTVNTEKEYHEERRR